MAGMHIHIAGVLVDLSEPEPECVSDISDIVGNNLKGPSGRRPICGSFG